MTIRELFVALGFEVDKSSEKKAEDRINGIKNMASKLLGAIGIGFSIAGLANLAEAAADVEALNSQFSQVFGEMESEAGKKLESIADDTGVAVNRMKGSFVQIAAFAKTTGMEAADALELSDRAMQAVADSAAFYDRSLEDVTNSLQSFLKGNFENDAVLGLSCTETTRNAAANALYGKSFKDLAEDQKQLTLLQMVEDANKASGALGQAARESDTWTNQLGNLKQSLKDLKAAAGQGILKPAVSVLKLFNGMVQNATALVSGLTDESGILTRGFDRAYALMKKMQPTAERLLGVMSRESKKIVGFLKTIAEWLGGTENAFKILALVAAAFFAVLNFTRFTGMAKNFVSMLSSIGKMFHLTALKTMALVAVIVVLALIVEDFIQFLLGNDSVIGSLFEKVGIDADAVRQAIFDAFGKVRDFLLSVWPQIQQTLDTVWQAIKDIAGVVFPAIYDLVVTILSNLKAFWDRWGSDITGFCQTLITSLSGFISGLLQVIQGIVHFISAVFTGDWEAAWDAVREILEGIVHMIMNILIAGLDFIKLIGSMISEAVMNGFQAAVDWIKALPENAVQWGADFVNGLIKGIKGAISGIGNAAKGVADTIKSYLHFSVPDVGPLTDYENWMPDFLSGLASGIEGNKDLVLDQIRSLAGDMSVLMQAGTAKAYTAGISTVNHTASSNMTQNVNISNSYSGGSMETQKNVSKAMKKSAVDATTYMARGLAYARG